MTTFKQFCENKEKLPFATASEQDIQFVTGKPVTFHYLRNTESAPYLGSKYLQDIEPAGRYMIHNENPGERNDRWSMGEMTFKSPLVIQFNPVDHVSYDENNWKHALYRHYEKTGKELSKALRQDGYDGIVTVGQGPYTKEIVAL